MVERALVTGATGFLGNYLTLRLLEEGFVVRAAVRSLERGQKLKTMLTRLTPAAEGLELARIDLTDDAGWVEAMDGVNYAHHLAAPLPHKAPGDLDALVAPTRDGMLRVLNAARNEIGMKRVIATSSSAAASYGWQDFRPNPVNESHWTDPDYLPGNTPHSRAATIAERSAWEWVRNEGQGLSLTTILPGLILGPVMSPKLPASAYLLKQLMQLRCPAVPRFGFIVTDVRDTAEAHLAAMTSAKADGRRFLVGSGFLTTLEISEVLAQTFPDLAHRFARREAPDFVTRLAASVWPGLRYFLPELNKVRAISTQRLENDLGVFPRPARETVRDAAMSLADLERASAIR